MTLKIVADSSANLPALADIPYASVPLKLVADTREFVDDETLDCGAMMEYLESYKGRSGSSCPSVGEWVEAFGDADCVFTLAISKAMSGSHNSALQAKEVYEEEHPGRKVCCIDSLTTGPELILMAEKIRELHGQGLEFEEIREKLLDYQKHTHMVFMLSSVDNLAKNGRVSTLIAKAVGILNIRIVGQASREGTFQQQHKSRGEKKGLQALLSLMEELGYRGSKVRINHVFNEGAAQMLKDMILEKYPETQVLVTPTTGLCSFYAERGGIMVGFED